MSEPEKMLWSLTVVSAAPLVVWLFWHYVIGAVVNVLYCAPTTARCLRVGPQT